MLRGSDAEWLLGCGWYWLGLGRRESRRRAALGLGRQSRSKATVPSARAKSPCQPFGRGRLRTGGRTRWHRRARYRRIPFRWCTCCRGGLAECRTCVRGQRLEPRHWRRATRCGRWSLPEQPRPTCSRRCRWIEGPTCSRPDWWLRPHPWRCRLGPISARQCAPRLVAGRTQRRGQLVLGVLRSCGSPLYHYA